MTAVLPKPESSFEPCPPGSHVARCIGFVDLGTHEETYQGNTTRKRKVMLTFETPLELTDENKPFVVSAWFTWSMHEKAKLREQLESWRGKPFKNSDFGEGGFHVRKLLGVPAMLNVMHTENGKAKIGAIAPLPKGTECPPQVNETRFVFLDPDEFIAEDFESLGEKLKERIVSSPEYGSLQRPPVLQPDSAEDEDDDCPF